MTHGPERDLPLPPELDPVLGLLTHYAPSGEVPPSDLPDLFVAMAGHGMRVGLREDSDASGIRQTVLHNPQLVWARDSAARALTNLQSLGRLLAAGDETIEELHAQWLGLLNQQAEQFDSPVGGETLIRLAVGGFVAGVQYASQDAEQATGLQEAISTVGIYWRPFAREIGHTLFRFGATGDEAVAQQLESRWREYVTVVPEPERLKLLDAVANAADRHEVSVIAVLPFVFRDPSPRLVSTATLRAAVLYPTESDPLVGVRELLGHAAAQPQAWRRAPMVAGLVLLGDRRSFEVLRGAWRLVDPEDRNALAMNFSGYLSAGYVEWLLDWLEDCEGAEFGQVAGALASLPARSYLPVVAEVRRSFPSWVGEEGDPIQHLRTWEWEEYASLLGPRVAEMAARETEPRVLPRLVTVWGLDSQGRLLAPTPLFPRLGAIADGHSASKDGVALESTDFERRQGRLLLSWLTLGPDGPRWHLVATLETERPGILALIHRRLGPNEDWGTAHGVIDAEAAGIPSALLSVIERLPALAEVSNDAVVAVEVHAEEGELASGLAAIVRQRFGPEFKDFGEEPLDTAAATMIAFKAWQSIPKHLIRPTRVTHCYWRWAGAATPAALLAETQTT